MLKKSLGFEIWKSEHGGGEASMREGGGCMRTKITDISKCVPLNSASVSVGPVV